MYNAMGAFRSTQHFNSSYNKDGNFRSRSLGRAGRAMGNGSFERSWTTHEHTMWHFLIFALPALPGERLRKLPSLLYDTITKQKPIHACLVISFQASANHERFQRC